mmetsp:Transcript_16590/g.19963  ORF Transcript_16590/g.19963 Transcript_16590/m.19963 type:complete len:185 (-) Transcript_16590:141-695(-)|eukprot:CAMPEP_0197866636 /NCGR_PEP_ID=MMETSP1438-20131217/44323_1 /TAXON_ID=1461541 /ORGANISM="Pterosperma sp., Strain CCMP1384" /LENGTH=184 /DNA_ID=CAMNT_0043485221 /DNA_START=431 /DNA_END=985 /DNA_ORIENTATION=-
MAVPNVDAEEEVQDWQEEEEEDEEDEYLVMKDTLPSPEPDVSFVFRTEKSEFGIRLLYISGRCVRRSASGDHPDQTIGTIQATLIHRPNGAFWRMCDTVSDELQTVSSECCYSDGTLKESGGLPEALGNDSERIAAASNGGFLYVNSIQLDPAERGRDLGLNFMLSLLDHLASAHNLHPVLQQP